MPDTMTVIREFERPEVPFVGAPGAATYRTIIGDDTGEGLPIRTGIQTSQPGYRTRVHSHPYVETLTVIFGARRSVARWRSRNYRAGAGESPWCCRPIGRMRFGSLATSRS